MLRIRTLKRKPRQNKFIENQDKDKEDEEKEAKPKMIKVKKKVVKGLDFNAKTPNN